MRQTTNYQLPSWDSEDRILRTDFNDLTEKVDAALSGHGAILAHAGNCRIETGTYVGTGIGGGSLPLEQTPLLVMVTSTTSSDFLFLFQGSRYGFSVVAKSISDTQVSRMNAAWTETKLSWSAYYTGTDSQANMNDSGVTYRYYALYAA